MGTTKIEWADAVWNPVTGCTKVSAGCANCYAERMAKRFPQIHGLDFMPAYPDYIGPTDADPVPFSRVVLHPDRLDQPPHWRKPRRVFVCSMGDLFHEDVPVSFIRDVWRVMANATHHTFMILTKRPKRMVEVVGGQNLIFSPHIQLGVSVENQETADERIPLLLQTPAAVRFVSVEPMLGPVDLRRGRWIPFYQTADEEPDEDPREVGYPPESVYTKTGKLDWVICGGETGPGARPMRPDWARSLRDQCQAAGVPFFFKHWGEWAPGWRAGEALAEGRTIHPNCRVHKWGEGEAASWSWRVGKKAAGRLLDGREWNEWPGSGGK